MNNSIIFRFTTQFLIYLVIVLGISAFPLYKFADAKILEGLGASFSLFFFLTVASFWLIVRKSTKTNTVILKNYFTSIGMKMGVALIYFMCMLQYFSGYELTFALTFFVAYLVCTCFEVYYLMHNLREI